MDASFRLLRMIQAALLVAAVFYIVIAEKLGHREPRDVKQIQTALIMLAAGLVAAILFFRQRLLPPTEEVLRMQPNDVPALQRWRTANLITLVMAESVVLYGFVLRFMGGTLLQAAPFYAGGVFLMLLFTPRRPE